jgi:hypothetical protein
MTWVELPLALLSADWREAGSHVTRGLGGALLLANWSPFGLMGEFIWERPPLLESVNFGA